MVLRKGVGDDSVRDKAAEWFERMRKPDAERYRAAFDAWRGSDPRHATAYDRYLEHWRLTGDLRHTEMGRARQLTPGRRFSFHLPAPRYALAGAALLVLVVVGSLLALSAASPPSQVASVGPALSTSVGQIRREHFGDGSTVTLDTDSTIEVAFSGSTRLIRLVRGRARFDVAHDVARPFIVEAAGRTVTARGTVFDVSLVGEGMSVSLLRGAVDVGIGSSVRPTPGPVSRLKAGQSLQAVTVKAMPVIRPSLRGQDRWVAGMLSFDGVRLADVIGQTNRYSERKLRLGDSSLGELKVTGAFRPLPVAELAAALAATFSLRVGMSANGDLVLLPPR